MTWFAQVAHVMKKDLRQHRWMIGLALVAAGIVTTQATGRPVLPEPASGGVGLIASLAGGIPLLTLASGLLVAFLIQSDSAARSDAFWVTRPLAPSALMAAKLAVAALVLVVLPLIGQLWALRTYGVAPGQMPMLLAQSALAQAGVLTIAACVAALTPDLRTFLVVLFLTFMGGAMAVEIFQAGIAAGGVPPAAWVSGALLTLLGLGLVAYQYRVRDTRRTVRAFLAPAGGCLALLAWLGSGRAAPPAGPSIPEALRPEGIQVLLDQVEPASSPSGRSGSQVSVSVNLVGPRPGVRYALTDIRLTVHLAEGGRRTPPTLGGGGFLNWARTAVEHVQWLDDPSPWENRQGRVGAIMPRETATALAEGNAWLELTGRVEANRSREIGRLPAREGARLLASGRRIDVVSFTDVGGAPFVTAVTQSVYPAGLTSSHATGSLLDRTEVALVDPSGTRGLHLWHGSASGGRGGPLVLPGPLTERYVGTFRPLSRPGAPTPDPTEWLPDARLAVFEWLPVGSDPVRFEVRGGIQDDSSPTH